MLVLITLSCQHFQIGTSDGVSTMLVDTIFAILFIFFPFSLFHSLLRPFLTEGVFGSKEWFGAANDLGLDPILDPGGHFGDPCWPFLILHKNYVIFPGIFLFSKYIFQLIGTTICTGLDMYKS